jgi:hypothetical protein
MSRLSINFEPLRIPRSAQDSVPGFAQRGSRRWRYARQIVEL